MIRCKHVSEALRDHNWEDLPPLKKLGLRIHVFLCLVCGRFNRQIMSLQSGVRRFTEQEEDVGPKCTLPLACADGIKDAMRKATSNVSD